MEKFSLELAKTAEKIVREEALLNLKSGQTLLICADTSSDPGVVSAVANAAYALGAQVTSVWFAEEASSKKSLPKPVEAAMANADVVLELMPGATFARSVLGERIVNIRCVSLGRFADADTLIRLVGKVNYPAMMELEGKLAQLTQRAKSVRMTNQAGTDVGYEIDPQRPFVRLAYYQPVQIGGFVCWAPVEETINGTVVVDGCVMRPQIDHKLMRTPIKLVIKEGKIVEIKGEYEAKLLEKFLASFKDPKMYNVVHFTYGTNPGTTIDHTHEGERVFGGTDMGIGWQNPVFKGKWGPAPAHCDVVVLDVSAWLDGEQIMKDGKYIHPELAEISKELASK